MFVCVRASCLWEWGVREIRPLIAIVQTIYSPPRLLQIFCVPATRSPSAPRSPASFLLHLSPHLTPLLRCTLFHQSHPFSRHFHVAPPHVSSPSLSHIHPFLLVQYSCPTLTTAALTLILIVNYALTANIFVLTYLYSLECVKIGHYL